MSLPGLLNQRGCSHRRWSSRPPGGRIETCFTRVLCAWVEAVVVVELFAAVGEGVGVGPAECGPVALEAFPGGMLVRLRRWRWRLCRLDRSGVLGEPGAVFVGDGEFGVGVTADRQHTEVE